MRHYIYRHIRLDKNEPFYIGIGTKLKKYKSYEAEYQRAFDTTHRSKMWKRIYDKTNKNIEIEILLESDDRSVVIQKEVEFIKLYGKIINKTGTLSNIRDGGEGSFNKPHSKETILKFKNRKISFETRNKIAETLKRKGIPSEELKKKQFLSRIKKVRPIVQLTKSGEFIKEWGYIALAAKELNINDAHIGCCCKKQRKTIGGFRWMYKDEYNNK